MGAEHGGDPFERATDSLVKFEIDSALREWNQHPSIVTATEAVAYAYSARNFEVGTPAARFLLSRSQELPPSLIQVAQEIQSKEHDPKKPKLEIGVSDLFSSSRQAAMSIIARSRDALKRDPRNIWKYLDIARAYIVLGNNEKARECIRSAIFLAPNHRGVLRVAARFYMHIDDKERAQSLIRGHPRTPHDPWLIATEISLSSLVGKHPKHYRRGREMISGSRLLKEHRTELAAALGTLEWEAGGSRVARKYFRESLIQPTDNVVAQIQSVVQDDRSFRVDAQHFSLPGSYEANHFRELNAGNIVPALEHCHRWMLDEAFSARPAIAGSFLAASVQRDYISAEQFSRTGLRADPNNSTLRNNLAISLAYLGNIEDAEKEFMKISRPFTEGYSETVYLASRGLLSYRKGNIAKGRDEYRMAMERASPREKFIMLSHWIREELNSDCTLADELVTRFDSSLSESKDKHPIFRQIADDIRKDLKRQLKLPLQRTQPDAPSL